MAWHGCAGINLSINTPRLGVDAPAPCTVTWMAMILVRVFVDAACMMSPYGTAWRRQKEEAGAESGFTSRPCDSA